MKPVTIAAVVATVVFLVVFAAFFIDFESVVNYIASRRWLQALIVSPIVGVAAGIITVGVKTDWGSSK